MDMRNFIAILCLLLCAAAVCSSATVYLTDGSDLTGEVRREGETVIVTTEDGRTHRLAADKVLYIAGDDAPKSTVPVETPPETSEQPDHPDPVGEEIKTSFDTGKASRPESVVFYMLRRRNASEPNESLERGIQHYRAMAHDRKRREGNKWVLPEDYVLARNRFEKALDEAEQFFEESDRIREDTRSAEQRARKKALLLKGREKLREATLFWLHLPIRLWLEGLAQQEAQKFDKAEGYLQHAVELLPYASAFRQARGMNRILLNRHLDGLEDLTAAVQLTDHRTEVARQLKEGLSAVPGRLMETPQFQAAREMLDTWPPRESRSRWRRERVVWFFGERSISQSRDPLPKPSMDRFDVLQAVAVPVCDHLLLMDGNVLEDAWGVIVRIDAETLIAGTIERLPRSVKSDLEAPLGMIRLDAYRFQPPERAERADLQADALATSFGANLYEEMGSEVRSIVLEVGEETEDGYPFAGGLAAGESTAPVFDADGRLIGFLAGKTDAMEDDANPDRFFPVEELEELFERVEKRRSDPEDLPAEPKEAGGKTFLVYVLRGERFEKE